MPNEVRTVWVVFFPIKKFNTKTFVLLLCVNPFLSNNKMRHINAIELTFTYVTNKQKLYIFFKIVPWHIPYLPPNGLLILVGC